MFRPALPFHILTHPSCSFSSKRTGSLILLASPRIDSSSPAWSLVPVHECLYPFVNQTSVTGLGCGVSPCPSYKDGECLHPSRQMPTPPVVEQKGQREGSVYVLEETVEAAAALNGAFYLL